MKLAIMQPYLFPYIGYFQLINAADIFVFYDDVQYTRRGWINRNNILVNQKKNLFTIPVRKTGRDSLIEDVRTDQDSSWRTKIVETVRRAYRKAPYFNTVFPMVEATFAAPETRISEIAKRSVRSVNRHLGIQTVIRDSSEIYDNRRLKGRTRILDICLKEKVQEYINPEAGRSLYDPDLFSDNNVKPIFMQPDRTIEYSQFQHDFVPDLSIMDMLMFNPKERIRTWLECFEANP